MRTVIAITSVVILIGAIVAGAVVSRPVRAQGTATHPLVTKAEYEHWQKELSNWGRWGKDIAILGWETPDYAPHSPGDLPPSSVHNFALTILGIHLIDRADFDAVAEAAAARNRWEFMLTIAPLRIPRGTGSPVNPIAMF